uniref:G-protein coupled receptors family 1 profile domain-containing protein n=1 Tax=Dendroctonus ponderosae TaxID=77166 RepID=A0AAR5PRE8_DENPD
MSGRLISKGIFRNKSQTEKMELFNETICSEEIYGPKRDELYIVLPISVIYLVIFITGTVGNITTCIVIYRNKSLHTATNYYLFSLAVSDLVLLVSGLPQEIYLIWSRYPYIFGNLFCFLRGLLAETSGNATVLTITGFTVERYLAICHPFLSHTMSKLSRAVKFILLIWFVAISFAIPQALPLKVAGDCPMCLPTEPVMNHSFEISTFVFFVAPMTLITVLYILIGTTLSTSNMMRTRSRSNRVHSKSSRKVIKMLVYFRKFQETFFKCCGLGIQRGKPPKQYSILSRSNVKNPPESTDSAKDEMFQTHTTLIYKNSNDSFPSSTNLFICRFKFSLHRLTKSNETHTISEKSNSFSTYASLPVVNNAQNESKLTKISQYFVCLRKNQENGKLAYGNRDGHPSMEFHLNGSERDSCDISNSSLKDIEKGAIEDELGAYINELKSGGI